MQTELLTSPNYCNNQWANGNQQEPNIPLAWESLVMMSVKRMAKLGAFLPFTGPGITKACHWTFVCLVSRHGQLHSIHPTNAFKDPRYWSRNDVATWLRHMAESHHLPEVPTERFIMNGKALCLMTVTMFLDRVPLGGKLLYKDFQLRLARAMYHSDPYLEY